MKRMTAWQQSGALSYVPTTRQNAPLFSIDFHYDTKTEPEAPQEKLKTWA